MRNGKKLLAMFLVFTLVFSHFAVVTEALATTSFVSIFGAKSDTGNENVEFEAYLANGEETSNALVSDVNNTNLAIQLQLGVKKSGYLKNGKVEIKPEENADLNFAMKEENQVAESEHVQVLENNVLEFNKIENSSEQLEISIPIEYKMEEYIQESKLKGIAHVILSGIYVDEKGKEHEISKEIPLTLAWKDDRAVKVEEEISKYVQYGNDGVILQTIVKVDSSNENQKSLPTKQTELNINVPKINEVSPTEVTVIANSTVGTNGKGVGEVEFGSENCTYNEAEGKINIKLENKKQLVDVNESEEYLKVEGEENKQEERYYSQAGMDEYVVTYTFQNVRLSDEIQTSSNLEAKVVTFSGVEANNMENLATAEKMHNLILTGQTGDIISYNVENDTPEVSKVYSYLNKEMEYNSKTTINVSYTDIVQEMMIEDVENYYMSKSGNKVPTEDIYYKQISVSQENFNNILGEAGNIQILDVSGNVLTTINKDSLVDESGNYNINFQDKISKVMIKTSAPINTGNLIISNKKATSSRSISKEAYADMDSIATTTVQKAKYSYVSDIVELGSRETATKLKDTVTDINFILDRDNLSTVTTNTNVEMRLELNNDKATSDIFGNSVFEIEMPEYITSLNITNASILYGEGLEISNLESYVRDGRIIAKVTVSGKQTDLNSGVLTNGTNIVLNADMNVDIYTPSVERGFKVYCNNEEATNYATEYKETQIQYSAPNGVIAINTTSNYNDAGSRLTSIKQGKQVDYLDIYAQAKKATMEIAVMNNNENAISNLAILGRIPFEGVKDITTGDNLGTTIDTKMVSRIATSQGNNGEFTIYYSDNKEATQDLKDNANRWTTTPENLETIKSYLIVPNDSNYKMEAKQVLKFTYEYQIPANLNHNENIYGTFVASYTNNMESVDLTEEARPDLIGLTTGAGPELELTLETDVNLVKENDEIKLKAIIKNVGQDIAQDVLVKLPVIAGTSFVSAEANRDIAKVEYSDGNVITNIEKLAKNASIEINITLKTGRIYAQNTMNISATAMAKDLKAELTSNKIDINFETAEISVDQFIDMEDGSYIEGNTLDIVLRVENLTQKVKENVEVVTSLPKELEFLNAYMIEANDNGGYNQIDNAKYDASTNQVIWNIQKIGANEGQTLKLFVKVKSLNTGITSNTIQVSTQVSGKDMEMYKAEDIMIDLAKSSISITQTSTTPTYVMEGENIHYTFTIKNEGQAIAKDIVLTDIIPEGIVVKEVSYEIDDVLSTRQMSDTGKTELTISVPENDEVQVDILATASSLEGAQEKTVTNVGTIANSEMDEITSNPVTHIIQAIENTNNADNHEDDDDTNYPYNSKSDITKSHKISGVAWLDANKNGMRDDGEQRMSNITAILVDSNTGVIKSTVTTNANGEYTFTGLQDGSYVVLFKYDTALYTVATYRKEGIESSINSDVITTKIEQNGKKENGAVTDVINVNGANISNIDIGLVETAQFSLGIEKAITKVTVQNAQGTVTEEFDKVKLAQSAITAKYLAGTTVYVEYAITVTNNGDLEGFASEIVDYIPQGMTFNSGLNPDWYTGTDGNLYTKALANTELVSGQSQEVKLVLTKQMTTENTGNVSNTAEIAEDFNIYGVSDKNSTPKNKAQNEDDISTADLIITVKTGETLIYLSAIIISILAGGAIAFVVYERVLKNKRKGGV